MKQKPCADGFEFDSNEELEFYYWVKEAKEANLIKDFEYQPESFILSTKKTVKVQHKLKTKTVLKEKHLLHDHIYTADFKIELTDVFIEQYPKAFLYPSNTIWIDVKGTFQRFDGNRSFSVNQKWVYDKYDIYVHKIIPEKIFKLTWAPKKCLITKSGKIRTKYQNFKQL